MTRRCGHGREGDAVRTCPACAMRISPADYWEIRRRPTRTTKENPR